MRRSTGKTWQSVCWLLPLVVVGLQQLASAGLVHAKAVLAPLLVQRAWESALADGQQHKPWPWADTWPVAQLRIPALAVDQFVLAGTRGNALAFGPGLDAATATPGQPGTAIIGGHRDTHFRFLQELRPGMQLGLQTGDGRWQLFEVTGAEVVDIRDMLEPPASTGPARLQLVTCYPFDALVAGGPLRYVVNARLEQAVPVFTM